MWSVQSDSQTQRFVIDRKVHAGKKSGAARCSPTAASGQGHSCTLSQYSVSCLGLVENKIFTELADDHIKVPYSCSTCLSISRNSSMAQPVHAHRLSTKLRRATPSATPLSTLLREFRGTPCTCCATVLPRPGSGTGTAAEEALFDVELGVSGDVSSGCLAGPLGSSAVTRACMHEAASDTEFHEHMFWFWIHMAICASSSIGLKDGSHHQSLCSLRNAHLAGGQVVERACV